MFTFSSLVSSITNAMTRLRHLNIARKEQNSALRRYLHERHVSTNLVGRTWGLLRKATRKARVLAHRGDVELLDLLPKALLAELMEEIYAPVLTTHPFFKTFAEDQPLVMQKICKDAIDDSSVEVRHHLFHDGDLADVMYFLISGSVEYECVHPRHNGDVQKLEVGCWISEPVLWIKWMHRGTATAMAHVELSVLPTKKWQEIAKHYLVEFPEASCYAHMFRQYFCNDACADRDDEEEEPPLLTDSWADLDVLAQLVDKAFESCRGSTTSDE